MNQKFSTKAFRSSLWVGALLLSAFAAFADTKVTFQIDMSVAISNGLFFPATETVVASGTFDGWATLGSVLTNNAHAANTNLYTGTYDDTADANGKVMDYQYRIITNGGVGSYSSQADGDNYCATLPTTSGASLVLPVQFWNDDGAGVTNTITFQVDMAEQLLLGNFNTSDGVYCQGSFEGWNDSFPMTNNPALNVTNGSFITSLVYQGTYTTWSASPGAAAEYKFVYNNGGDQYEAPLTGDPDNNNNRYLFNQTQVLPLVSYSDSPFTSTVTNNVTFVIDMSIQEDVKNFTPGTSTVEIHGDYNSWGAGTTMTNNPNASNTNLYSTTIQFVSGAGSQRYFKYVIQPGTQWENVSAANSIGGNRWLNLADSSVNFSNGPVYYSDEGPSSLPDFITVTNCMVTFTVNMTNATGTGPGGSVAFDNSTNSAVSVWLNGLNGGINNSFWTWGQAPFGGGQAGFQMTQVPNTLLFTITLPVNIGQNGDLIYKYSMNGYDDEAASGDNHARWVRSLPNYTMPVDTYGVDATEISFGNLAVTNVSQGKISVSWLGRDGVHLQTSSALNASAAWTNLYLTDGTNLTVAPGGNVSTNLNVGAGNLFYRLVGPQ